MQSMALSCGYIGVYGSCRQPLRWQAVQSWQAANQRAKSFHSGFCVRQHKSCPWNGWLIFLHSHGFCRGIPFLCTTQCSWISTQFFLDKDKNILPQEDSVQGSSQWQTRFDFFVSLSYSHFILGQTNFAPLKKVCRSEVLSWTTVHLEACNALLNLIFLLVGCFCVFHFIFTICYYPIQMYFNSRFQNQRTDKPTWSSVLYLILWLFGIQIFIQHSLFMFPYHKL